MVLGVPTIRRHRARSNTGNWIGFTRERWATCTRDEIASLQAEKRGGLDPMFAE